MPLTQDEIRKRQEFTTKLQNYTITREEAQELNRILVKEQREAASANDFIALIAIGALIVAVLAFLRDRD
jgi:uncharacterized membrane protein